MSYSIIHLLTLIGFTYAAQVVLLDTKGSKIDLKWDTFSMRGGSDSEGQGWIEESWRDDTTSNENLNLNNRAYVSCSFGEEIIPDSWVFTPFIETKAAQLLHISLTFNTRSCENFPGNPKQCRETFGVFYKEFQAKQPALTKSYFNVTKDEWKSLGLMTNSPTAQQRTVANLTISLSESTRFIRLGFEEDGACVSLLSTKMYYMTCDRTVSKFAQFPEIVTNRQRDDMARADGKCIDHAVPNDGSSAPVGFCGPYGEWKYTVGECYCMPGYAAHVHHGNESCRACSMNWYKSERGDAQCIPCPANSANDREGSSECKCLPGYYRADGENINMSCTQPPKSPVNLSVQNVDQTSAILEWEEPASLGGRREIWYGWECGSKHSQCTGIHSTPADKRLTTRMLRLSGLMPNTDYSINVYAMNKVSEKAGTMAAYQTVEFHTKPPSLHVVTGLRVETELKDEITLAWTPPAGVLTPSEYEIEIRSSQRNMPAMHMSRTSSFSVKELHPNVQYEFRVRANSNGWSEWCRPFVFRLSDGIFDSQPRKIHPSDPQSTPLDDVPAWVLVLATLFLILLLAFLLIMCRRRNNNRKQMSDLDVLDTYKQDTMTPDYNSPHHHHFNDLFRAAKLNAPLIPSYGSSISQPPPYYGQNVSAFKPYVDPTAYEDPNQALTEFTFDIDPAAVMITQVIGGGEFGDVCMGRLKRSLIVPGGISFDNDVETVAIKTLKPGSGAKAKADFLLEASIMGQFSHQNVIKLIGVVTRAEPVMIVAEFMANGSLDHFLRGKDARGENLGWPRIIDMLRGIAAGMKYLTDKGYVHRDLAARNVLVDAELTCKIADFGLSRGVDDTAEQEYTTNGGKIPVRWTAPEAITHRKFTAASDVWSFGVLVWEVCSFGERPYWDWTNQKVINEMMSGYRLPAPMDCPLALHKLMLWCWRLERHDRPSFGQLLALLEKFNRNPELLHVDQGMMTTRHAVSSVNVSSGYGSAHGSPMLSCPPPPTGAPPTFPTLEEFLRSLGMGHCMEKLNKEGVFSVYDLTKKSHLDLLAMGLISEEYNRIRDALVQLQMSRGLSRPIDAATATMPSRSTAARHQRRDDGFFV